MKRTEIRFFVILLALLLVALVVLSAQEKATLITPVVSSTTVSTYEITGVLLQRGTSAQPTYKFVIFYVDNIGNIFTDEHVGNDAAVLIKALNKANLSTKSLERRALEHLISEGKIPAASITGVPQ